LIEFSFDLSSEMMTIFESTSAHSNDLEQTMINDELLSTDELLCVGKAVCSCFREQLS